MKCATGRMNIYDEIYSSFIHIFIYRSTKVPLHESEMVIVVKARRKKNDRTGKDRLNVNYGIFKHPFLFLLLHFYCFQFAYRWQKEEEKWHVLISYLLVIYTIPFYYFSGCIALLYEDANCCWLHVKLTFINRLQDISTLCEWQVLYSSLSFIVEKASLKSKRSKNGWISCSIEVSSWFTWFFGRVC